MTVAVDLGLVEGDVLFGVVEPVVSDELVKADRSRKRPKDAPTHVRSWPLRLTPRQHKLARARFHAGVRVYNACLAESFARCAVMRADPRFEQAKAMKPGKDRTALFNQVRDDAGFTERSIQSFASSLRRSWVREQSLSQETQAMAARAFHAVADWNHGRKGRPRYKAAARGLHSLACKDPFGAMKPKVTADGGIALQWGRGVLIAGAAVTSHGRLGREQRAELAAIAELIADKKVLQARIVRTVIGGRDTYRMQLVCDGPAPQRHPVGDGVVSIDLGPSNVAAVTTAPDGRITSTSIEALAPALADTRAELRRLQRRLDRQHRAGSPGCFDEKGRHRRGCLWRDRSKAARRTRIEIAEVHRRRAAYRDTSHGGQVNRWLAAGREFRAEKLNYVAWQKNFPRSVRDRAPGLLMEKVARKAASAGGRLYEYATYSTACSSTCICGVRKKKKLSQRTHRCACGAVAQRDVFAAFLGLHVSPTPRRGGKTIDLLDVQMAREGWTADHDTDWQPAPSSTATPLRRGKKQGRRPPTRRSLARTRARRKRQTTDRASRLNPGTPPPGGTPPAPTVAVTTHPAAAA